MRVSIGVAGGGVGVRFRWVVRGGFPVEIEGKGEWGWEGSGAGWGHAKELASQCVQVCQNYPLANYPLASPRVIAGTAPESQKPIRDVYNPVSN